MTRRITAKYLAMAAVVIASVSCGDVIRQGRSPVYLVIDRFLVGAGGTTSPTFVESPLLSDVRTKGSVFNDLGQVTMRISVRDIGPGVNPVDPTLNNEVTINRYHVVYRRADGRNTPGVDVPYPFDGAVTATVGTNGRTFGFNLVRHTAKLESPLRELIFNLTILHTIAEVTFYGRDQVGNELSATAYISVDFADFGDPS